MYHRDYQPLDGIIFEDFARTRERLAVDHRTQAPAKTIWYMGGFHRFTREYLQGHPTRADSRLRKF